MNMKPLLLSAAACIVIVWPVNFAGASTESVIYSFPHGTYAYGHLDEIHPGLMYGTGYNQDAHGTVFQFKESHGHWKARTIHDFAGSDGANPRAGLTGGTQTGVYYGTTRYGGSSNSGTVYSITRGASGWTESVLHSLGGADGYYPDSNLMRDRASGQLFGTATFGGSADCGTVFALDPANENWKVLYNFQGGSDGCDPEAQLRAGSKNGTVLGTTVFGGGSNSGTVFALTELDGSWTEAVVHSFGSGGDAANPADVDVDNKNTVYGVAMNGGTHGVGAVFEITNALRTPKYSIIYSFTGGSDGRSPVGLHLDNSTGILYGTTQAGGAGGRGVAFRLTFDGVGWTETVLHSFLGGADGATPAGRPVLESVTGNVYGTTLKGGAYNGGVVYRITP